MKHALAHWSQHLEHAIDINRPAFARWCSAIHHGNVIASHPHTSAQENNAANTNLLQMPVQMETEYFPAKKQPARCAQVNSSRWVLIRHPLCITTHMIWLRTQTWKPLCHRLHHRLQAVSQTIMTMAMKIPDSIIFIHLQWPVSRHSGWQMSSLIEAIPRSIFLFVKFSELQEKVKDGFNYFSSYASLRMFSLSKCSTPKFVNTNFSFYKIKRHYWISILFQCNLVRPSVLTLQCAQCIRNNVLHNVTFLCPCRPEPFCLGKWKISTLVLCTYFAQSLTFFQNVRIYPWSR